MNQSPFNFMTNNLLRHPETPLKSTTVNCSVKVYLMLLKNYTKKQYESFSQERMIFYRGEITSK